MAWCAGGCRPPGRGRPGSWSGPGRQAARAVCPKNDESAGKRRSTRLRPGAPWLKALLVQSAWCAVRTKATYLHALFQRLKARRGPRKAIVAVAAAMLTAIYHMLKRGAAYHDLGHAELPVLMPHLCE